MTPAEIRSAVRTLQAQRHSLREISRLLRLSRNTVRRILREPDGNVAEALPCDEATLVHGEGCLRAGSRQRGARARTAGRRRSGGVLQQLDPLGAGGRPAQSAAACRRVRVRARAGDAARHLAASRDLRGRRQAGDRAMRRPGAGLLAPAVHPVLPAVHPLRGQGVPARGRALHGRCLSGLHHRQHQRAARRRCRRRGRHRPGDGGLRPHSGLPVPRPPGREIQIARAGSKDHSPMSRRISWQAEASKISTTSTARHSPGAARSPTESPRQRSACRQMPPTSSSSRTSCRCPTRCRRSTSCWNASSTCTALSASIPTATPCPSASSASPSLSTSTPPKSMSAARTRRSPSTGG